MATWNFWRRWLKTGEAPQDMAVADGTVYWGYWHDHEFKRVAVWPDADGSVKASYDGKPVDPAKALERVLNLRKPATAVTYEAWIANRDKAVPFPKQRALQMAEEERAKLVEQERAAEQLTAEIEAGPGHNQPPERPAEDDLYEKITELGRTFRAEQRRVEADPKLRDAEETAKFFTSIAQQAHDMAQLGERMRKAEGDPLRKKVEEINKRWHRPVDLAVNLKGMAKDMTKPYHDRLERERADADRRAQENRDKMSADARFQKRATGTTRMKTVVQVEVTDWEALGLYFLRLKEIPVGVSAAIAHEAQKRVAAGVEDLPGVTVTTTKEPML